MCRAALHHSPKAKAPPVSRRSDSASVRLRKVRAILACILLAMVSGCPSQRGSPTIEQVSNHSSLRRSSATRSWGEWGWCGVSGGVSFVRPVQILWRMTVLYGSSGWATASLPLASVCSRVVLKRCRSSPVCRESEKRMAFPLALYAKPWGLEDPRNNHRQWHLLVRQPARPVLAACILHQLLALL